MILRPLKYKFQTSLAILMLLMSFSMIAQDVEDVYEDSESEPQNLSFIELSFERTFPISTFQENLDRNLSGGSLTYIYQYNKKRMNFFGVELNFAHIGSVSTTFFDSSVTTGSNILGLNFLYRHFPDFYFWKIEPFIEVGLGPQFFYTQTTTSFFDIEASDDIDFEEFDTSLMYGIGLGFNLHIAQQVFFVTKVSFNGGTAATYLVDRDDSFSFPADNFRPETTQTGYIRWKFGFSVSI